MRSTCSARSAAEKAAASASMWAGLRLCPAVPPHPNVLRAAGLDPDEYTGFYVNIGLDRLVMMRYGVDDVRLFHSAGLEILKAVPIRESSTQKGGLIK